MNEVAYCKLKEGDAVKVNRFGNDYHGQFGIVKSTFQMWDGELVAEVALCYSGGDVIIKEDELLLSTHDHQAFSDEDNDLEDSYEIVGFSDSDQDILNSLVARVSALEKDFYGIKNKD